MTLPYRLLVLIAALLLATSAAACGSSAEPTATAPVPQDAQPFETTTAPTDAWERIQSEGKMVVGTSADYPPFESFNDEFEIVGFDIALIEAIAEDLGVGVEIEDIAFDGLAAALTVGQIDVAIAAISVTPEREGAFDFSHFYFVSEDAYLAAPDAEIAPISVIEDLADYRVGVQRGTVFEKALEESLVEAGLMSPTSLFLYGRVEDGFVDLEEGKVDLLVLDLQPALVAAEENGFEIAARGLNRERYAIAMAMGQNDLRTNVNQALLGLQSSGVVAELALTYLDVEREHLIALPTPMPDQPPSAPVAPPTGSACVNGMAWVADLNYDDQNMTSPPAMRPGEAFQKGWRVRNTGTCTWDGGYSLAFASGNRLGAQMGGQPVSVQGQVPPGATYDFYVNLVAPLRPGVYRGNWEMRNPSNQAFGERVYVGITVTSGATATPAPTQTPSPGIQFTADDTSINEGECTTIRWNVTNIDSVFFYSEGQRWQDHGVTGQGAREVCPSQTTTYYLRVVKTDGSVETRSITIQVSQNAEAPDILRFEVQPSGQIAVGQCVSISWDVGGKVDRVNILRDGGALWNNAPYRGSYQDCPSGTGDVAYGIEAIGPGGTSRASRHVNVVPNAPTVTPAPTGVPAPVISAFTVTPGQIGAGQCVNVAWSTAGGTERVTLIRGGNVVLDHAGLSGAEQDCLGEAGTVEYRLEASNRAGEMVSASATVEVRDSQPPTEPPPTPEPTQAPEPPSISDFSAKPKKLDPENTCVTLSWSLSGGALSLLTLFRNGETIATDPSSGYQDCVDPGLAGTTIVYRLKADAEFGGSDQAELEVPFGGE